MIPKDIADSKNAIIEIRPGITSNILNIYKNKGTGGLEASLFALDIFHMYQKFCLKKGWKVDILKFEKTDLGGVKVIKKILRVIYILLKGTFSFHNWCGCIWIYEI